MSFRRAGSSHQGSIWADGPDEATDERDRAGEVDVAPNPEQGTSVAAARSEPEERTPDHRNLEIPDLAMTWSMSATPERLRHFRAGRL